MQGRHDISHCSSNGCIKRDTCHRYIMHLEARKNDMIWLAYLNPAVCIEEDYKYYWEEKK